MVHADYSDDDCLSVGGPNSVGGSDSDYVNLVVVDDSDSDFVNLVMVDNSDSNSVYMMVRLVVLITFVVVTVLDLMEL